ncbi:MAG: hypothetical protein JNL87_13530 [Burkholderiaceae bacterium]|nr:hypothetical protein [Burkholderiaceae bacterium]
MGDTPADIAEGRSAGMRCIGITATGNEVGLDAVALAALPAAERARRLARAEARLSGADALLESAALLPAWMEGQAS